VTYLLQFALFIVSLFLVLLVLVQRGRGGGLAGALGGAGGQSAFGSKSGDVFTKITIGVATVWILLCMVTITLMNRGTAGPLNQGIGSAATGQLDTSTPNADGTKPGAGTAPGTNAAPGANSFVPGAPPAAGAGAPAATGAATTGAAGADAPAGAAAAPAAPANTAAPAPANTAAPAATTLESK